MFLICQRKQLSQQPTTDHAHYDQHSYSAHKLFQTALHVIDTGVDEAYAVLGACPANFG